MKSAILLFFLFATIALGATGEPPNPSDEFISPLLLYALFGLFFLVVGIVIVAIVIAVGIVFSATFVGILRRRFSSGFRAFHYQVWAIGGLLTGVCGLSVGSFFIRLQLDPFAILAIGSIVGVGSSLLLAFAFDRLARIAYQRFVTTLPNDRNI